MALKAIGTPGAPGNDREALRAQTQGLQGRSTLTLHAGDETWVLSVRRAMFTDAFCKTGRGRHPLTQHFNTKNEQVPPTGRALSEGRWPLQP